MRDRENRFVDHVRNALLAGGFNVELHEDKDRRYIPDLSFAVSKTDGWIECKWQDSAPYANGRIDLTNFTEGQREWLCRRGAAGCGQCYLLLGWFRGWAMWRAPFLPAAAKVSDWERLRLLRGFQLYDQPQGEWRDALVEALV